MFDKVEVGRVFGIPVLLDVSFIALVLVWGHHYFTSGSVEQISYGLLLVAGVALSILLHEFGHAAASAYYGVPTTHIELNALGGVCYAARALPADRIANIVVLMAGPAVTCVLWLVFTGLYMLAADLPDAWGPLGGIGRLSGLMWHLAYLNWWLLLFNLLPSHPLDGGRTLAHCLSRWMGYDRAMRVVAITGFAVVAWVVWRALDGSYFAFLMAFFLFQANQQALEVHRGPRWQRWN